MEQNKHIKQFYKNTIVNKKSAITLLLAYFANRLATVPFYTARCRKSDHKAHLCDCYAALKAQIITLNVLILSNSFCFFKHKEASVQRLTGNSEP